MEDNEDLGDIAALSQSCITTFKELLQHQITAPTDEAAPTERDSSTIEGPFQNQRLSPTNKTSDQGALIHKGWFIQDADSTALLHAVETAFARFKIWAGNLGALQRGSSSLDVRLRESSVMRIAIVQILKGLRETLNECSQVVSGQRLPFEQQTQPSHHDDTTSSEGSIEESDSESDKDMTELEMRAQSIQSFLTDLYRLSFKIRNTTSRGNGSRALAFKQLDKESGFNVFSAYEKLDRQHVYEYLSSIRQTRVTQIDSSSKESTGQSTNAQWPNLDESTVELLVKQPIQPIRRLEDDFFACRLALANTHRRQHFAYWRRHSLKLSTERECLPTTKYTASVGPTQAEQVSPSGLPLSVLTRPSLYPSSQIAYTTISGTEATKFNTKREDTIDTETIISYATTAYGVAGEAVKLPPPPPDAATQPEFLCFICHVVCPSKQGKGKDWRTHVLQDLQPYICTYPECETAATLYSSRKTWLEHERIAHRRIWQCHEHPNRVFQSKATFQEHLDDEHDDLTDMHAQQIASFSESTVSDDRTKCPFCLELGPFPNGLPNHMAFHHEQIAAFSLSWDTQALKNGGSQSSNAQGLRSEDSLESVLLEFDDDRKPTIPSIGITEAEEILQPGSTSTLNALKHLDTRYEHYGELDHVEKMHQWAGEDQENISVELTSTSSQSIDDEPESHLKVPEDQYELDNREESLEEDDLQRSEDSPPLPALTSTIVPVVSTDSHVNIPVTPQASDVEMQNIFSREKDALHSETSHPQQKPARRISSTTGQYSLLSPPRSAPPVTSHSFKNDVVAGEDVILLSVTEEGTINKHVVRMRAASIQYSLIREDVVLERGLRSSLVKLDEFSVSVPHGTDTEDLEDIQVSFSISITWRRPGSNSTHATKFYVVPNDTIDTDLLLGNADSGQSTLGYVQHVTSSSAQQQRGLDMSGLAPYVPPRAPDPPPRSYHASGLHDSSSTVTATQKRHFDDNPATQKYQRSHSTHAKQNSVRAAGTLANPVPEVDHNNDSSKLRLNILWDATQINVWLNMAGPGEAFFKAFQKEVGKRKTIPDRAMIRIIFKNDKDMPDELAYPLCLDEDSLDAEWDTIAEWLDANKRDKVPNIYGWVEIDEE